MLRKKRIYELSNLKLSKKKPLRESFRHLITLVQTGKDKSLKGEQKTRAKKVSKWLKNYAGSDMKFEIQEKLNVNLTKKQKEAMTLLKEVLSIKRLTEDKLFNEFYNICDGVRIPVKEFFETAYETIIGKPKGPRLATLILSIGKEKVIKLLNQIK